MKQYTTRTQELSSDLNLNIERNKQNLQDFSRKEEEVVVLKVELNNMQEKFKAKVGEVKINCT